MPFALKTRQTIRQAARISGRFGCGVALWQEAAEPEPLRMLKELDLPMPFSGQCKPRPTHRSTLTDSVSMSVLSQINLPLYSWIRGLVIQCFHEVWVTGEGAPPSLPRSEQNALIRRTKHDKAINASRLQHLALNSRS